MDMVISSVMFTNRVRLHVEATPRMSMAQDKVAPPLVLALCCVVCGCARVCDRERDCVWLCLYIVCVSVPLSVCTSLSFVSVSLPSLYVCWLPACLLAYLPTYLPAWLYVCLSVCPSVCLSYICMTAGPSVCYPTYLYVCVCLLDHFVSFHLPQARMIELPSSCSRMAKRSPNIGSLTGPDRVLPLLPVPMLLLVLALAHIPLLGRVSWRGGVDLFRASSSDSNRTMEAIIKMLELRNIYPRS